MRVPWGEGNGDGGVEREGLVSGWGMHRPAPLPWIPAFAGTGTMGR